MVILQIKKKPDRCEGAGQGKSEINSEGHHGRYLRQRYSRPRPRAIVNSDFKASESTVTQADSEPRRINAPEQSVNNKNSQNIGTPFLRGEKNKSPADQKDQRGFQ
jgi:hypothetical protein